VGGQIVGLAGVRRVSVSVGRHEMKRDAIILFLMLAAMALFLWWSRV
jgi:hypothetical protein